MFATGKRRIASLVVLFLASTGLAQPLYHPTEHFYNAQGRSVSAEWQVDRNDLSASDTLLAQLVIKGASNPTQVQKPNLRGLDKFRDRFEITDLSDTPPAANAPEVVFHYALRPRSTQVAELPELTFHYINPAAPEGKQVRTTYARKIPLQVRAPSPKTTRREEPIEIPVAFDRLTEEPMLPASPGRASWLMLLLGLPALSLAGIALWRRWNPQGARLMRLRRNQSVARVLDALAAAERSPDPAASAAQAVQRYLVERWGLPVAATVPAEIARGLPRTEAGETCREATLAFFQHCDESRFAPHAPSTADVARQARMLVLAWENAV